MRPSDREGTVDFPTLMSIEAEARRKARDEEPTRRLAAAVDRDPARRKRREEMKAERERARREWRERGDGG